MSATVAEMAYKGKLANEANPQAKLAPYLWSTSRLQLRRIKPDWATESPIKTGGIV